MSSKQPFLKPRYRSERKPLLLLAHAGMMNKLWNLDEAAASLEQGKDAKLMLPLVDSIDVFSEKKKKYVEECMVALEKHYKEEGIEVTTELAPNISTKGGKPHNFILVTFPAGTAAKTLTRVSNLILTYNMIALKVPEKLRDQPDPFGVDVISIDPSREHSRLRLVQDVAEKRMLMVFPKIPEAKYHDDLAARGWRLLQDEGKGRAYAYRMKRGEEAACREEAKTDFVDMANRMRAELTGNPQPPVHPGEWEVG